MEACPPEFGDERYWRRWFWWLALGHVAVWTLVPALTQANGPLDAMEMLYWGREWQWGYYKHPPLPAWLAHGASSLFGHTVWPTYLLSQLCILACLWSAWRLLEGRVSPWLALCAAAMIEASAFYNYTTPELNNNMLRRGMTALTVLFIYWAMSRRKLVYWAAGGLFVGLGLLSKYDHGLLVVTILAFAVLHRQARPHWGTAGPYVLAAVAFAVFLPHAWWMIQHDFITLQYVQERTASDGGWLDHVLHPLKFSLQQLAAVALMLLLATQLLGWQWRRRGELGEQDRLLRDYLAAVVLGPFLLTVLLSALTGSYVRSMLGAPMWMFLPALLLVAFERRQGRHEPRICRRVALTCAGFSLLLAGVVAGRNLFGSALQGEILRIDYPGRRLAAEVQQRWRRHAEGPLPLVGGDWWPAANAGFYLPSTVPVYPQLDPSYAPWTGDAELASRGGVILWQIPLRSDTRPAEWLQRFPQAVVEPPIVIPHEKAPGVEPLRVGVAIVPPRGTRSPRATRPPLRVARP